MIIYTLDIRRHSGVYLASNYFSCRGDCWEAIQEEARRNHRHHGRFSFGLALFAILGILHMQEEEPEGGSYDRRR